MKKGHLISEVLEHSQNWWIENNLKIIHNLKHNSKLNKTKQKGAKKKERNIEASGKSVVLQHFNTKYHEIPRRTQINMSLSP